MNKLRTNLIRKTAVTAGFAIATSLLAQDEKPYELQPYEVIGKEEALFNVPGSGIVLSGNLIEDYKVEDLNRLLMRVPGVYFREEDGYGLLANVSLRGVDTSRSSKLTLMEDGIPTAPAPYSAPAAYYTPTAGRMSGIEILKGTSQVKYGPHTTGGVINYLSTPIPGRQAGYAELAVGNDGDRRIHFWYGDRYNGESGILDSLVEFYGRQVDGFQTIESTPEYAGSDNTGFTRQDSMVKLGFKPSETSPLHLELKVGYTDLDADISYLGLSDADFNADPYQRYSASRLDNLNTKQVRSYLRMTYDLSNDWKLMMTGYYNNFHRNWLKLNDIRDIDLDGNGILEGAEGNPTASLSLSNAIAGAENGAGLEALKGTRSALFRIRANNRDYYTAGTDIKLRGLSERWGFDTTTELGFRIHRDRIRRLQWHELHDQNANGGWTLRQISDLGSDGNRRQETTAYAAFIEEEYRKGKWSFRPGIRAEYLDYKYSEFQTDLADNSQDLTLESTGNLNVWSLGLASQYQFNETMAAFVNAYRGFSTPGPGAYINDGIQEEQSTSAEAGWRFQSKDQNHRAEIVAFYTQFDDLIVIDNIGSGNTGNGLTENVGSVDSYGIEFIATSEFFASDNAWSIPVTLSATFTEATLDGDANSTDAESIFAGGLDGNSIPYIPDFKANLSIAFKMEKFQTGFSFHYQTDAYSTAVETTNQINPSNGQPDARYGKIDSTTLLDWFFQYHLNDRATVFVNVNNVFDKSYLVSRHPHGARPGAPRQFLAGIQYQF